MSASVTDSSKAQTLDAIESRRGVAVAGLLAGSTALMLEATRVFLSYTVFVVDQSERVKLAAIALAVFLAFGLAVVIAHSRGTRDAIIVSAGLLLVARILLQFWEEPAARAALGAVALIGWGWLLIPLLSVARDWAAFGVGAGFVVDLAVRIATWTVDLPWMPTVTKDLLTLVLCATVAVAVAIATRPGLRAPQEPYVRSAASLIAVGPALAVYHLAIGNLGLIEVKTGRSPDTFGFWLLFGMMMGVFVSQEVWGDDARNRFRMVTKLAMTLCAPLGIWLLWEDVGAGPAWVFLAAVGFAGLVVWALRSGGRVAMRPGVGRSTLWLTIGMLVQGAIVFAYFTFTGDPRSIAVAVVLLIVGAWLPGLTEATALPVRFPRSGLLSLVLVLVAAVPPGIALLTSEDVEAGAPLAREITVMTYNIQLGFSRDKHWSLEQTARTIEAEDPDIVILQEVSRGWIIAAGVDEVRWLSKRLDMPVVFGAASRDGLWGNAILTRAPIASTSIAVYSSTQNLRRGAVVLQLDTETGDLWVVGTHLDNPEEAGEVRLEQVGELLKVWDGKRPAILAGDFNATPDSDVLAALTNAGFVDTGASLPVGAFTMEDGRRIDYIMTAGPIATGKVGIPDVWTSDHKPVVVELTLGG